MLSKGKKDLQKYNRKKNFFKHRNVVPMLYQKISGHFSMTAFPYPGRESNPHCRNGNRILSPACLPVPPPGHYLKKNLSNKRGF